jgi:DNA-binding transcriptional ArsR family regulator
MPRRSRPVTRRDDEPVWRALASPLRRAILDTLRDGPKTTGELAEQFPELTRFAVMQHLRMLEESELVVPRRVGRQRYNYLNPVPIQQVHDRWVVRYLAPWTEALVRLREEVESTPRAKRR